MITRSVSAGHQDYLHCHTTDRVFLSLSNYLTLSSYWNSVIELEGYRASAHSSIQKRGSATGRPYAPEPLGWGKFTEIIFLHMQVYCRWILCALFFTEFWACAYAYLFFLRTRCIFSYLILSLCKCPTNGRCIYFEIFTAVVSYCFMD
jgi:hypothetical protein